MVRMRHSPESRVSTINCVLMYFSGFPSSYSALEITQAVSRPSNVTRSGPRVRLDVALELDVRREMVLFVLGPGFDLSRLHEDGVGRNETHRCAGVAAGDCVVEGVDDRCNVNLARRRLCAREQRHQEGGQNAAEGLMTHEFYRI